MLGFSQIHLFNKSILLRIMRSKASFILFKFLQSINMKKKQHEYKPYIYIYIDICVCVCVINLTLKN
jgi:hypothetical protein